MDHQIRRLRPWLVSLTLVVGCAEPTDHQALEIQPQPATVASLRPARLWLYNVGLGAPQLQQAWRLLAPPL